MARKTGFKGGFSINAKSLLSVQLTFYSNERNK